MNDIEYHIYRIVDSKSENQSFVFTVSRDVDTSTLHIHEIWSVIKIDGKEYKARLDIDLLSKNMYDNIDNQVSRLDYERLYHNFSEILSNEVLMQHQISVLESDIKKLQMERESDISDRLISAGDSACSVHPNALDVGFDELIRYRYDNHGKNPGT